MDTCKIALVVSHPVQHFCPQYASWAKVPGIKLKVFFGSNMGAAKYYDVNFKKDISWDNLYLDDFDHEFLNGEKTLSPDKNLAADNIDERLGNYAPELVVYYGYFQKLSRQASNWASKNNIRTAYISDAELRHKQPLWKQLLKYPYLRYILKKPDYFFTVGDANENYYHHYGVPAVKFKRMHFPVDIKLYDTAYTNSLTLRQELRYQLQIPEQDITISVAGKLVSWKSQDHLIQLLYRMEASHPERRIHLIIAGSGEKENEWRELAHALKINKVHFPGFLKPEKLTAIYAATDIYIHPARIEPHSLSISEAIYMGCPVIVADTTGSWGKNDDVQPGINGLVYPFGNIALLEECVLSVLLNRKFFSEASFIISRSFQKKAHGEILKNI